MGRPGCRQCCDDEAPDVCTIPLDTVFSNGNNETVGMSESEFRKLVRHTGDPRPDNPPEDYDDYVISENVIDEIFSGKENLSGIGTYVVDLDEKFDVQRIITSVIKDDNYSFSMSIRGYDLSSTVGSNVEEDRGRPRTEIKTKTRKLFISSREVEISGEFVYMLTIEIAGKSFEFPYSYTKITESTFFLDLSLSPDIVDMNFNPNSYGRDDAFCFNMMEELGEYLPEDELKEVDFIEILPPGYFRDLITFLIEEGGGTDNASDASVPTGLDRDYITQFLVYNKEGTEKLLFNVFQNPFNEVTAEYRDHRAVGGTAYYTEIDKSFIDQINFINRNKSTRERLLPVLKAFYVKYSGWEIIGDGGLPDAATKSIAQSTFIEEAKHHILKEFFQNDVSVPKYIHVEYIGDVDQKRDIRGRRVRETETEVAASQMSDTIDDIFGSSEFLKDMIGEVDDLIALLDTKIQISDLSMNLTQGDTTATGVFNSNLRVADSYLPGLSDYTYEEVGFRRERDEDDSYTGPEYYGSIEDIDDYRYNYYCTIEFKDIEGGAMLNYEKTRCDSFSSNDYYGSETLIPLENPDWDGWIIGKQIYVEPSCGIIASRGGGLRLPNVSSHNEEYTSHYEGTDQTLPRAVLDVDLRYDRLDKECGHEFVSAQEYEVKLDTEIVGQGTADVGGVYSRNSLTVNGLRLNSANEGEWAYAKQYKEYIQIEKQEKTSFTYNTVIESTNESSLDELLREEGNRLIRKYEGDNFREGDVSGFAPWRDVSVPNPVPTRLILKPIFNLYAIRYNLFSEGDAVKTHNYVSQWPSISFETIAMKPNTRGYNIAVAEKRVNEEAEFEVAPVGGIDEFFIGISIDSPTTRSYPSDYVRMDTKQFNVIYHKGKDTNYIKPNAINIFMGDSLHSCSMTVKHSQMPKDDVVGPNYVQIQSGPERGMEGFDEATELLSFLEWERKVSTVRCIPAEKTYHIAAEREYSHWVHHQGGGLGIPTVTESVVSRDYTYIELLEGVEEEETPSSIFLPNSGEDSFYEGIKDLVYQLSVGEGTTSTDIVKCLETFYRQRNTMIWDSEGYFLDVITELGAAGKDYNLGSKTLSPVTTWDFNNENCKTCKPNNSLRYTISWNGVDRRRAVILDGVEYERVRQHLWNDVGQGGNFCVDYTYKTSKLVQHTGLGQRIYYDIDTFGADFYNSVGSYASSETGGSWPGEAVVDLEWSTDCLTNIGGFSQIYGSPTFYPTGGEIKTKTSGGYYIHADAVQGSNYYYYNYKFKVSSSVKLRAYPFRSTYDSVGKSCGYLGDRWNLNADSNIIYAYFSDGICNFNVNGFEGWSEYGPWEACDCPSVSKSFRDLINGCAVAFPKSATVKTWNYIVNHNVFIFAEDQSFSTIDIRDFPQKIKENRTTGKPSVNNSITLESYGNIKINNLDIDTISFRWGPDEYYEL